MKTYNYNINLMTPMQINKEVLFNESIVTIDNFCNSRIIDFIDQLPADVSLDQKYIISSGDNTDYICYCPHPSKGWQLLKPQTGMIMFVQKKNSFYIFEDNKRNIINFGNTLTPNIQANLMGGNEFFESAINKFEVPAVSERLYLYLNGNCQFNFDKSRAREITIIIKQNYQKIYQTTWPNNILWKNKTPHKMTSTINSFDIIKFYKLVETNHFLAEIIGQDYKF